MNFTKKSGTRIICETRVTKPSVFLAFIKDFIFYKSVRYMVYFRLSQNLKNKLSNLFYEYKLYRLCRKYGIEIKTDTKIG